MAKTLNLANSFSHSIEAARQTASLIKSSADSTPKKDEPSEPKKEASKDEAPKPKAEAKSRSEKGSRSHSKKLTLERLSRPTYVFNIRIPEELNSLLDDLLYQRKKTGNPTTKQELGIEAIFELMKREGFVPPINSSTA